MRKSKKDYTDRTWNSLGQLKETIEADRSENIVSFNGWQLVTNKYIYGLFDGKLTRRSVEEYLASKS